MGSFISLLGRLLQGVGQLTLPFFGEIRKKSRVVFQIVHMILVGVVAVSLSLLDLKLRVSTYIPPYYRNWGFWLPLLFLLVYAMAWGGWQLYLLLLAPAEPPEFPDIAQAWDEARTTLEKAGFNLTALPVFLVLGQPEEDERILFAASQVKFQVKGVPTRPDAPLRVYAAPDGIYVICPGASILALHTAVLSGLGLDKPSDNLAAGEDDYQPEVTMTIVAGKKRGAYRFQKAIREITARGDRTLKDASRGDQHLLRAEARRQRPSASLARHPDFMALQESRLRYLCRLLVRDRTPYCPVNGLLLLIPFAGTDSEQDAVDTGEHFRREIEIVQSALQIRCPVFALVCNVEVANGFTEYVRHFPTNERQRRLGHRYPLDPEYGRNATREVQAEHLTALTDWVCNITLTGLVFDHFNLETSSKLTLETTIHDNGELFMFLNEITQRRKFLRMIVTRGLDVKVGDPALFGGLYLAGTGMAVGEQAFVAGVFDRLVKEQNFVSWTDEAFREDAKLKAKISWVYIGLGAAILVFLAVVGFIGYEYEKATHRKTPARHPTR